LKKKKLTLIFVYGIDELRILIEKTSPERKKASEVDVA
jgi:hypothetical protein